LIVVRNRTWIFKTDYFSDLEPFGTAEDLMLASEKAEGDEVYAAFRPPDSQLHLCAVILNFAWDPKIIITWLIG
jgi:hypothetical protein